VEKVLLLNFKIFVVVFEWCQEGATSLKEICMKKGIKEL